ncbi:MAG: AMP-binding protein, partial [Psychrosphaera sp.]|nr:AMP-binding protein [Psychrosphaera sp.]
MQRLGQGVFADPSQPLKALSLLGEQDRTDVLALGNHERYNLQTCREQHVFAVFNQVVTTHPDNIAISADGVQLSYQQLLEAVDRMSAQLVTKAQIGKGDVVAVHLPKSADSVIIMLALFKLGAVYLPLDIKHPAKRMAYILQDAQAKLCVDAALLQQIKSSGLAPLAPVEFDGSFCGSDSAYLIYTSGSTGQPKGVMLAHHGFVNMCLAQIEAFSIDSDDRVMWFASAAFDASMSEIFMALLKGACLCIGQDDDIQDLLRFDTFIKKHRVNVLTLPPVYLHQLDTATLAGVKTLITAGEAPIKQDVQNYYQLLSYFNAYGPSESSVCAT